MKHTVLLFLLSSFFFNKASAQVFDVDTLLFSGESSKRINFVFMGDGYTATTQSDFISAVGNYKNYLFSTPPFSSYKNYFNVFAIKVVSNELGESHPNTAFDCNTAYPPVPTSDKDTYFKCSFDFGGVHRCIYVNNNTAVYDVLATNFPNYDQIIILSNNIYYGGCGGAYAVSTIDASSTETVVHELGHSFGHLEDEYAKPSASEAPNLTQTTDSSSIKWKNWLGGNGIGIYPVDTNNVWFRPHQNCKMKALNKPFCSVCKEALIEQIHNAVSSLDSYSPSNPNVGDTSAVLNFRLNLIHPNPNTLQSKWTLDGVPFANNIDSVQVVQNTLTSGTHALKALIVDTTELVRVDFHSSVHYATVTWNITKTTAGIKSWAEDNQFAVQAYPNPVRDQLNIAFKTQKTVNATVSLFDMQGKVIQKVLKNEKIEGEFFKSLDVSTLEKGNYVLEFVIDQAVHRENIVKL